MNDLTVLSAGRRRGLLAATVGRRVRIGLHFALRQRHLQNQMQFGTLLMSTLGSARSHVESS